MTLRKFAAAALMISSLTACNKAGDDPQNFIGVWENKTPSQPDNGLAIKDRILIESQDGKVFQVSILARGVFAEMRYDAKSGYICAENNACFGLKDRSTLLVGTEQGNTVAYTKEQQ